MSMIKDYFINGYKIHAEHFESASSVVDVSNTRKNTDSDFYDMRERVDGDEWYGVKAFGDALELLRVGYQPVVNELKSVLKPTVRGVVGRFSFSNSVQGFAPVVPLALKGVPNCMIDMHMKPIKAKVLDVYYDATFSCAVDSDDIIKTGKKMLNVIMNLEREGYRFNLYMVQSYSNDNDCDMMIVKVKSADRPIDLKRISFPIAHTSFFRVIGFDWYGKLPGGKYRFGYGHGLAYGKSDKELTKMARQMWGKNSVYFAGANILRKGEDYIKETITNERKD